MFTSKYYPFTEGPRLEIGKTLIFEFSLENWWLESQHFSVFRVSNFKIPSTTEDMPVGARRFEEFLKISNVHVFKFKNSTLKDKTIEKLP